MADKAISIRDEIKKLEQLPPRQAEIGVVAENGEIGAAGQVSIPVTKWGTFTAAGAWMKDAGYKVAAKLGFRW